MSMHEDAMALLSQIYEAVRETGAFDISRSDYLKMAPRDRQTLENCLNYLRDEGFVKPYAPCAGTPVSVTITSGGIKKIENVVSNEGVIQFSGNNYGIIGISVKGNTISQPMPFDQYKQILDKERLSDAERREVIEIVQDLFERSAKGYPVEKGMLSKIKNTLAQHQALLVPIEELILHYIFSSK